MIISSLKRVHWVSRKRAIIYIKKMTRKTEATEGHYNAKYLKKGVRR